MFTRDPKSSWKLPLGASLCGIGGIGTPMKMDFLGGHTLGSVAFSAVAIGMFLAATVWMFRRWGDTRGGSTVGPATLTEEESEAIWAELTAGLDAEVSDKPATAAERERSPHS